MALKTINNTVSGAMALSRDDVVTAAPTRPTTVSRRDLFRLALPEQRILPRVDTSVCAGRQCALCAEVCPTRAIDFEDDILCLDGAACDGCGVCLSACPYQAMICEDYGTPALEAALEGALTQSELLLLTSREDQTDGVGTVSLPHPCLLTPWLLLRALTLGARGILIDFSEAIDTVTPNVKFVRDLLVLMGDDPARLVLLAAGDDSATRIEMLRQLGDSRIAAAHETASGVPLTVLLHQIGLPDAGVIEGEHVPFGWLEADAAKCSSCGICAQICPTGALILSGEADTELTYRHDQCVACGRCVRHCPEQCLELTHRLDLVRWDLPPVVLGSSVMLHCVKCGAPVAPRATIETLRGRLAAAGIKDVAYLELCPECKLRRSSEIL
jgi:Fe-S-cluster-containing hydrogenase component 2